jgi:ABC-type multidrug transport system ATPase subunit
LIVIEGTTTAVDGITFRVRSGEIVGLRSLNGAGKTTTINIVLLGAVGECR